MYPGGISDARSSCVARARPHRRSAVAANHFASIVDDGWQDRLREVGRRALWEGAQPIRIGEVDGWPRLVIRGGTIVTAGARQAALAADGGRISAMKTTCRGQRQVRIG